MVEKVRISVIVMVKDSARQDQMWSPVGDEVAYFLPNADVATTRRTLVEALRGSGGFVKLTGSTPKSRLIVDGCSTQFQ